MPYEVLAGSEPCKGGWLVLSGNLQGTNLAPQPPQIFTTFQELTDWKPACSVGPDPRPSPRRRPGRLFRPRHTRVPSAPAAP